MSKEERLRNYRRSSAGVVPVGNPCGVEDVGGVRQPSTVDVEGKIIGVRNGEGEGEGGEEEEEVEEEEGAEGEGEEGHHGVSESGFSERSVCNNATTSTCLDMGGSGGVLAFFPGVFWWGFSACCECLRRE